MKVTNKPTQSSKVTFKTRPDKIDTDELTDDQRLFYSAKDELGTDEAQ
jgi:hypothetical protein